MCACVRTVGTRDAVRPQVSTACPYPPGQPHTHLPTCFVHDGARGHVIIALLSPTPPHYPPPPPAHPPLQGRTPADLVSREVQRLPSTCHHGAAGGAGAAGGSGWPPGSAQGTAGPSAAAAPPPPPSCCFSWGSGANYQLGSGSTDFHGAPVRVEALQVGRSGTRRAGPATRSGAALRPHTYTPLQAQAHANAWQGRLPAIMMHA